MNFYTYLKKKIEDGTVKNLYKGGVCTHKVTGYVEIFERYNEYLKSGLTISNSVFKTSIDFKISDRNVWRIIKFMSNDLFSNTI